MTTSTSIIAEAQDVRYGANGYYDIRLIREGLDSVLIEVEVNIFFNFIPLIGNPTIKWTQEEKH